jgi:hypothetical protein
MIWRISGAMWMEMVIGTAAVAEAMSDEREVLRENPVNERPSRPYSIDVLLKSYIACQIEAFDIAGKCDHDMGCHGMWGWHLSRADITIARLIGCCATGEGEDNV